MRKRGKGEGISYEKRRFFLFPKDFEFSVNDERGGNTRVACRNYYRREEESRLHR